MANRLVPIKEINQRLPKNSLLRAIEYIDERFDGTSGQKKRMVLCVCKCGEKTKAVASDLMRGYPLSCGHLKPGPKVKGKSARAKIKPTTAVKPIVTKGVTKVQKVAVIKKEPSSTPKMTPYQLSRRKLKSGG